MQGWYPPARLDGSERRPGEGAEAHPRLWRRAALMSACTRRPRSELVVLREPALNYSDLEG